jgi:uncharacterized membrane protein
VSPSDVEGGAGPAWPAKVGLVLTLLGAADAAYLTVAHYTSSAVLACPTNSVINCGKVTTSAYSHILGVPVAVLGLAFFLAMIPLQSPRAWRSDHPYVRVGRLGACVIGVVMVLWLIYAELFLIGAICEYCTGVHLLTFGLFVSTALGTIATSRQPAT